MHRVTHQHGFNARRNLRFVGQIASAIGDGETVVVPSSVIAGDLLVLVDHDISSGAEPTLVVPSGFNTFLDYGGDVNASGFFSRLVASYKIAAASDAGATLTGLEGEDDSSGKVLVVYRGNVPITGVSATDSGGTNTNGNPGAVSVNASGAATPVLVIGAYGSGGGINPRTMSPAKDGEVGDASTTCWQAWKIYNADPANVSVDMDDEGNLNTVAGGYLVLS